MCCPKSYDTKGWAFACAYLSLMMFGTLFLLTMPFVCHPAIFSAESMYNYEHPSYYNYLGSTAYTMLCVLCFGCLLVAGLSFLCIYGIQKGRGGFLIPYLVVKSIIALIIVGCAILAFVVINANMNGEASVEMENESLMAEELGKATVGAMVLWTLITLWIFISPIVVVSTHCHRLLTGATIVQYSNAPLISMEVPPAQDDVPPYHYAVKSVGSV